MSEKKEKVDNEKIEKLKSYRFSSENQPAGRGRPKGSLNFRTVYKRYLKQLVNIEDKDGNTLEIPAIDALVIRVLENAIKTGDSLAAERISNRVDGFPLQSIENTNKTPLEVIYTPMTKEDLEKQDNVETNINEIYDTKK
jgi:hypothetical protein